MSLNLYDEAMLNKFRGVFENTVFSGPDEVFEALAELHGASEVPKMPAISIHRYQSSVNSRLDSHPGSFLGQKLSYVDQTKSEVYNTLTMPLQLEYMVELWATKRSIVNDLTSQILFWLKRRPNIKIDIPKVGEEQVFSIDVMDDIPDNTQISDFTERGRLYRTTLTLVIDNARLFNVYQDKTVLLVDVDLDAEEDLS